MFQFTKFVIVDALDNSVGMLLVSFRNKYVVYNANRRRMHTDVMRAERGVDPVTLINQEQFEIWFHGSNYRLSNFHDIKPMSYDDAIAYTNDRYDIHQMMRNILFPACVHDPRMDRMDRRSIVTRAENLVNRHITRLNGTESGNEPHARFKGSYFYNASIYKLARNTFKAFGHLVARAKAGDESISDDDLTEAFFDLDNRYHDYTTHISSAFYVLDNDFRLDITHCDCGHYESDSNVHDVRGDSWCDSCFSDDAVYVEDVDEYWPRDDAYYCDGDDCYYSYERDYDSDDDNDDDSEQSIMSYSTNVLSVLGKSSPIISSQFGEFTMGIELEMSSGDSHCEASADDVRSRLGTDYCIIKHDGSLPHNGFEVVTTPQGLSVHIAKFKAWDIDPAYRAWNTGKCGMHVHIDSRAFTQMTLGKFLMFVNSAANMDFIRKIAGRHPMVDDQARSYCAAEHQSILSNPKQAVKGKSGERYRMVNMCNLGGREALRLGLSMDNSYNGKYNTVELRIFRASLKKERLLAQIEFTHASVMFCRVASWRDLNGASFIKWLKSVAGQYPALVKWYGVRNVHTSTPTVIAPAEVTCTDAVPPAPWTPDALTQRHDHHYPFDIPYDTDHNTLRLWAERNYLTYRFATYAGAEYLYFPYGSWSDRICDGDVVYQRVADQWVLQDPTYAGVLAACAYTATA